jgi:uncharacterized repeat protein (TIGR01451 family)
VVCSPCARERAYKPPPNRRHQYHEERCHSPPRGFIPLHPQVLALFQDELADSRHAGSRGGRPGVLPRFAGCYQGLARLPRRLRRLKYLSVFLFALAMLGWGTRAQAIDSDDLAMAVTASSDPVAPGDGVLYQLTATNRGTTPTSVGVTMTAFIPGDTSFDGVTDGGVYPGGSGGFCTTGEAVTWSLSDLPAGASRTVGLSVRVFASTVPDGALIGQQAAVTSEGVSASADRTVIAKRTPLLSLNMRTDREPIEPGAPLTYTLVFGNRGQLSALGVTLRANVPAGTSFQSADEGGTQSGGVVSWSLGTVGAGQSGERRFTVIVDAPVAAGEILLPEENRRYVWVVSQVRSNAGYFYPELVIGDTFIQSVKSISDYFVISRLKRIK